MSLDSIVRPVVVQVVPAMHSPGQKSRRDNPSVQEAGDLGESKALQMLDD